MLPKKNHFPLRTEFNRIRKDGQLFSSRFFGLLVCHKLVPAEQPAQFAFIVSRRVAPKATERNRIKRQLSEIVRLLLPKLEKGFEVVFLPKKEINEADFNQLATEVESQFKRVGLL